MKKFSKAALAFTAMAMSLSAATTATWEMNTYQDFLKGRFQGLSLDRDGRLTVAPKLETVFSSGQPTIWSIARGRMVPSTPAPGIADACIKSLPPVRAI